MTGVALDNEADDGLEDGCSDPAAFPALDDVLEARVQFSVQQTLLQMTRAYQGFAGHVVRVVVRDGTLRPDFCRAVESAAQNIRLEICAGGSMTCVSTWGSSVLHGLLGNDEIVAEETEAMRSQCRRLDGFRELRSHPDDAVFEYPTLLATMFGHPHAAQHSLYRACTTVLVSLPPALLRWRRDGDVIITVGAHDVYLYNESDAERVSSQFQPDPAETCCSTKSVFFPSEPSATCRLFLPHVGNPRWLLVETCRSSFGPRTGVTPWVEHVAVEDMETRAAAGVTLLSRREGSELHGCVYEFDGVFDASKDVFVLPTLDIRVEVDGCAGPFELRASVVGTQRPE